MDLESRLRLQASALAPSFCQLAILATFLRLLLLLCVCVSHSVASDSLQPHRFLCPLQPLQQLGSSVRGILQARILQEWVSISFSRGSFWLRDQTLVSCTAARFFTAWAIREAILLLWTPKIIVIGKINIELVDKMQNAKLHLNIRKTIPIILICWIW